MLSFPGRIPNEKSSSSIGTNAPAPSPVPLPGQRGCLSSTTAILHSLITSGSNMRLPSYHQAQTIPGMTCPPCSSTDIREPGFHQCPLTRIAGVSLVDQRIISWRERVGISGSGTYMMAQYHHHERRGIAGIMSRRHSEDKSPTNFSIERPPHIISRFLKLDCPMPIIPRAITSRTAMLTRRATAGLCVPSVWTGGCQKNGRGESNPKASAI